MEEEEEEKDLLTDLRIRARLWQRLFIVVGDLGEKPNWEFGWLRITTVEGRSFARRFQPYEKRLLGLMINTCGPI